MVERKKIRSAEPKRTSDTKVDQIKLPPYSLEAEQSVLGGLMLDNERWDSVAERLVAQDFYLHAHRLIFKSIKKLIEQNRPVDLVTLSEHLEISDDLEQIGGFAYLAELAKNTPSAANIKAYADIVRERALIREMISIANEIADAGYDPQGQTSKELLDLAESKVFAIAESRSSGESGPVGINDILSQAIGDIEKLGAQPHRGLTGVSTGFTDLDKKTSGLQRGDLVIVAARPSMGKTAFAMNICENASLEQDKPVLIFSLEMPAHQLAKRMLASISRVHLSKIINADLVDEDWARLSSTIGLINDKQNMYIDDSSGLTPTELRARARRIYRETGGLSMIMVDYLQLMRVPGMQDNRTLEIAEISRSLKALAKDLQVPVVALSQLNRSVEGRPNKRPMNSDLRESGSIEQDADLIMFIYRDDYYNKESQDKGLAEIIIGKHRNGAIGTVKLTFQGQFSRFDNYAGSQYDYS